ncbi:MAG: Type 1 glutamine amidotransferase-like domain-containing protein [Microthrixaceae bacterium]|nr:Type 1 glutamine amidotransferase-like domain-containing protein [Microthrixaceae bacterium]
MTDPNGSTTPAGSLALVGGAEFGTTHDHHRGLFASGSTVTLLPTAMAYENPAALASEARAHFDALGVSVEVIPAFTRPDAHDAEMVARLRDAEHLYVTGGSPMHLRAVLHESPLLAAGVQRWNEGMTVTAAAESTSVLCGHMVDHRGGAFTAGLGLIRTFTVIARFDRWSPEKRRRTVALAPPDMPVVGIDEATALVRGADGAWSADGSGGVHVFVGGSPAELSDLPTALS